MKKKNQSAQPAVERRSTKTTPVSLNLHIPAEASFPEGAIVKISIDDSLGIGKVKRSKLIKHAVDLIKLDKPVELRGKK